MICSVRAFAVFGVLVAACNEPPGVTLEVLRTDKAVTKVELYLGEKCDGCPSVMAPPQMTPRRAHLFKVNDPTVFSATEWNGDRAGFRLESATGMLQKVPLILAVGYDANDKPIAASSFYDGEIPVDHGEVWITTLTSTTPIVDPMPDADGERIAVWPQRRRGPRCVMLEHGTSIADAVVPADDTDCDGLAAANECAPYVPTAVNTVPTLATANCVTHVPAANGAQLCMLGGPVCNEMTAITVVTCDPLDVDYCAPSKLCAVCPDGNFDCIKSALQQASIGLPRINGVECSIPMNPDGTVCADESRRHDELDLSGLLEGGSTKCVDVAVSELALPISLHHSMPVGGATLTIRNFTEPCKVDIEWTGRYDRNAGGERLLIVEAELDNGKHIVAPFYLHMAETCIGSMRCSPVVPDAFDSMFQCVKPAESSTTCMPTAVSCNGGIACGARCCAPGESCRDGECRCGDGAHCSRGDSCVEAPTAGCGTRCGPSTSN